jgi:HSP20 family molecular chaperone IbpA
MVTINRTQRPSAASSAKRALLVGLASLAVAHGHLVMAAGNPFLRTDRALHRLTRMLDELVDGNGLPPQVQPLWRRVVQQQPQQETDMSQSPRPLAADASVLAFRAEAIETPDSYVIQADLPGVKRSDIRIAFHDGNVLGITASRANPYEWAAGAKAEEGKDSKDKGGKASASNDVEVAQPSAAADSAEAYPKYLMREIAYGKSFRSFKLPSDASPETASATFENGVLTVVVKKREQPKEKVIEIQ